MIVAFGLIVQGVAVWKLRRAVKLGRLVPFLIGGAIGVPIGAELLRWTSPAALRVAIGIILVVFSVYSLWRPKLGSATGAGPVADGGVGILNGVIGGATGLAGIAATVWCGLPGWPAAEQRAVFQPVGVSVFVMAGALVRQYRNARSGYTGSVSYRIVGSRRRHLGRPQIIRSTRRERISPSGSSPLAGIGSESSRYGPLE